LIIKTELQKEAVSGGSIKGSYHFFFSPIITNAELNVGGTYETA
jgi:hypothetical protein